MINFNKILFPTDFSKFSEIVIPYCIEFAQKFNSTIYILNVVEIFLPDPDYLGAYDDLNKLQSDFQKEAQKNMAVLAEKIKEKNQDANIAANVIIGKPFLEIIKFAKENNIDMIIMGTHGRSGLNHMIFGSTAEKVVRKAPCPVLSVKHPDHEFIMP